MNKIFTSFVLSLLLAPFLSAQVGNYYSTITVNDSSSALKAKLVQLVTTTHSTQLSYTPGIWNALEVADLDLTNNSKVVLVYGYDDSNESVLYHRTRSKSNRGGSNGQWNREHVYAKSLGVPPLGESGPGADAHHIRPADVQFNALRGNSKFGDNTGNARLNQTGTFYPGDEWKGDVARMMMYMYLRYDTRCLPANVGVSPISISRIDQMIDLFILWHEQDPVSDLETQRNNAIATRQGNRNPFIDHPEYVAKIWRTRDGQTPTTSVSTNNSPSFTVYPNPTNATITISSNKGEQYTFSVSDALGRVITSGDQYTTTIDISENPNGAYFLSINGQQSNKIIKIIKR